MLSHCLRFSTSLCPLRKIHDSIYHTYHTIAAIACREQEADHIWNKLAYNMVQTEKGNKSITPVEVLYKLTESAELTAALSERQGETPDQQLLKLTLEDVTSGPERALFSLSFWGEVCAMAVTSATRVLVIRFMTVNDSHCLVCSATCHQ